MLVIFMIRHYLRYRSTNSHRESDSSFVCEIVVDRVENLALPGDFLIIGVLYSVLGDYE